MFNRCKFGEYCLYAHRKSAQVTEMKVLKIKVELLKNDLNEERNDVINCPDNFLKKEIIKIETIIQSNDKRHSSIMTKLQRENIILKKVC